MKAYQRNGGQVEEESITWQEINGHGQDEKKEVEEEVNGNSASFTPTKCWMNRRQMKKTTS